jgi:hypothetical protein
MCSTGTLKYESIVTYSHKERESVMKRVLFCLALLLTFIPAAVYGQSGQAVGLFAFTLQGYTVQGQLSNVVIRPDNSISMTMTVDDSLQTPIGAVPITGNGEWYGTVNGTTVSGTIANVSGSIQVCYFIFFCGYANYIGNGTWTGRLSADNGAGTFRGFITFTSSSFSQIPLNRPIPVSGNWSSIFQSSS